VGGKELTGVSFPNLWQGLVSVSSGDEHLHGQSGFNRTNPLSSLTLTVKDITLECELCGVSMADIRKDRIGNCWQEISFARKKQPNQRVFIEKALSIRYFC
jgi:hypothetical protein